MGATFRKKREEERGAPATHECFKPERTTISKAEVILQTAIQLRLKGGFSLLESWIRFMRLKQTVRDYPERLTYEQIELR
jgi:hypothetical protein